MNKQETIDIYAELDNENNTEDDDNGSVKSTAIDSPIDSPLSRADLNEEKETVEEKESTSDLASGSFTSLTTPSRVQSSGLYSGKSPFPEPLESLLVNESNLFTLLHDKLETDKPRLFSILDRKRKLLGRISNYEKVRASTNRQLPHFMGSVTLLDVNLDGSLTCMDALIKCQDKLQNLADEFIINVIDTNITLLNAELNFLAEEEMKFFSPIDIKKDFISILNNFLITHELRYTKDSFKRVLCNLAFLYPPKLRSAIAVDTLKPSEKRVSNQVVHSNLSFKKGKKK